MSTITLLDLPRELILPINNNLHGRKGSRTTFYIGQSPRHDQPGADALSRVCSGLRQVVLADFRTTTFIYTSPASGSHSGAWYHNAAHDLLAWLHSLPVCKAHKSIGCSGVRKLKLEMYASELLWLFAPAEASQVLGMPLPGNRNDWSRVSLKLGELRLQEFKVTILDHTCPGPCHNGVMGGGLHSRLPLSNGSMPRHFTPDHRWIVKSIIESTQHLPASALTISWRGQRLSTEEVNLITACSWKMLHSSSSFHVCDTLAYDGRQRFWASVNDQKLEYLTPVVWVNAARKSREDVVDVYSDSVDLADALLMMFDEDGSVQVN